MLGYHHIPRGPVEEHAAALDFHRPALAGGFDGRWPPLDPPGAKIVPFPLDRRRSPKPAAPEDGSGVQTERGVERAPAEDGRAERDHTDQA